MRAEAIVVGLLFSGAMACTSIIGTRDLVLAEPDTAASGVTSPHVAGPGASDGGDGGTARERADADDGTERDDNTPDAGAGAGDAEVAPGPNFARENGATATATTTYSGFPASRLIDGDIETSWYAGDGACTMSGAGSSCTGVSVTLTLAGARTVRRLVLYGNHDKFSHYDVLTGRWELLGPNNTFLATVNVTLSPPSFNGTTLLPTAVSGVTVVRFVVLTGDAPDPGLGELEIYTR